MKRTKCISCNKPLAKTSMWRCDYHLKITNEQKRKKKQVKEVYFTWKQFTYKCDICDFRTNNKVVYLNHIGKAHKLRGANRP